MRRIAHLLEHPTLSGGERSLLATLACLDRRRYAPLLVAPGGGALAAAAAAAGLPFKARPHDDEGLLALLARARVDLLHANSLAMGCRTGPLSRRLGLPAVAHVRDIMRLGAVRRAALLENRCLIAVSRATARALEAAGVPGEKVRVIVNGVDPEAFPPRAEAAAGLRRELGCGAAVPLVGSVGQLSLRKGQDVFLRAAARIAAAHPDARFVLVGARFSGKRESIDYETALRARAARPPLAGRVHFLGFRPDGPALVAALSVLVSASHQEPLGRVLLEALAAGTPVIATAVGGTPEIVEHGRSGLLVPPGDDGRMADAVLRLLNSGPLARRLAAAGRERAVRLFSPRVAANRTASLYEEVLSQEATAP